MSDDFDLEAGLKRLHLPTVRRVYLELQEQAEKEGWSYRDFLSRLVGEELAHRTETRISRATSKARFPFIKTIEEFDFTFQTSVRRKALGRFLGPELVSEGRSAILLGRPGRGKTHLAIAFAYKAIQNGFVARFVTVAEMLNDLHRVGDEGRADVVASFVAPDVLVLDELGYLTYGPDAANLLFQIVDQRYLARRPIIVTSNKDPSAWGAVLHDNDLAEAIVDRLFERGDVIRLLGKSYRNPRDNEQEGAA
jgi:DNA replication protein DnaC